MTKRFRGWKVVLEHLGWFLLLSFSMGLAKVFTIWENREPPMGIVVFWDDRFVCQIETLFTMIVMKQVFGFYVIPMTLHIFGLFLLGGVVVVFLGWSGMVEEVASRFFEEVSEDG